MKSSFSPQYSTPKKKSPWKSDTVAQGVNMEGSLHVSKFPLILFEIIMYARLHVSVSDLDIASKPWILVYTIVQFCGYRGQVMCQGQCANGGA